MAAPRWLVRHLLFPLHERLRGRGTLRFYRWMRANDRLRPESLQELHDRLLVEHLRHAASTVPFYRERVDPGLIEAPADLKRFPVLEKADVRAAGERLVSGAFRGRVFPRETGGSSGEPLRFLTDDRRESSQLACKLRARAWWRVPPGHRETDLWGSPIELQKGGRLRGLSERLLGFQLLSAFDMSPSTMAAFREQLAAGRCDVLYGYPSAMARYARFLLSRGETLRDLPLRLVVCTAETLFDADRDSIAAVVPAPVANEYGCRDGGLVAHEGPEGFHLMHDAVHVEVLGSDGESVAPGAVGEVVLTNLHARGATLVRYRVGDRMRVDPEPPRGSLPHPRLLALEGRVADSLVREDGSRVHGLALIYVLRELPGVDRFRCVQESAGQVRIELVPGPGFERASIQEGIIDRVRRVLGAGIRVDVRLMEELEPHSSGKHHYVICNVPD